MTTRPNLTEQEILTDFISQEKQLVHYYASDVTESSCPNLRQLLIRHLTECSEDQYNVFEEMKRKQFYKPKDAPDYDVQTAKQTMQQLRQSTGI